MRRFITSTALIAALGFTPIANAQEAAAEDSSEFDIGQSVAPGVGDPYMGETFGDWAFRCVKAPEGQEDQCNLYQLLINDEGVSVAEVSIFKLPEGGQAQAGATIVVPLETFLPEQLTLAVDGENARVYPYRFCNRAGCVARIGLTAAEVAQLKAGANGSLRIVPAATPSSEVVLNISLSGFTAGYDALAALPVE